MLNFLGNIARPVPRGCRAAAAEVLAGTTEGAVAGAPPARIPAAMPWPENLMDCAVLSVKYRGGYDGANVVNPRSQYVHMFGSLLTLVDC